MYVFKNWKKKRINLKICFIVVCLQHPCCVQTHMLWCNYIQYIIYVSYTYRTIVPTRNELCWDLFLQQFILETRHFTIDPSLKLFSFVIYQFNEEMCARILFHAKFAILHRAPFQTNVFVATRRKTLHKVKCYLKTILCYDSKLDSPDNVPTTSILCRPSWHLLQIVFYSAVIIHRLVFGINVISVTRKVGTVFVQLVFLHTHRSDNDINNHFRTVPCLPLVAPQGMPCSLPH